MGILKIIQQERQKRDVEETKSKILETLAKEGVDENTLKVMKTIKAGNSSELTTAFKNIQEFMKATPVGQEQELQGKIKEVSETSLISEKAKLDPSIIMRKLDVRAREKDQDLKYKMEENFLDIQKQLIQKGVDLDSGEKQKLVFSEQGLKTVAESQRLLNDANFAQAVFQSAGGAIGKLSTAGQIELRNYNTAIGASIFSFVFANSGAQVSDKERTAFENIYGLQIGDTLDNGKYKAQLLGDFFQTARDIIDPNRVAGLSAIELKGKLNEIRNGISALGVGDSEDAKIIMDGLRNRALGNTQASSSMAYEDKDKETRYQAWKAKQSAK